LDKCFLYYMAGLPSVERRISVIIENVHLLDKNTKTTIAQMVSQELSTKAFRGNSSREINIDLDYVAAENEELLTRLYRTVCARLEVLRTPATNT
jgi:hypothetical protein